MSAMLNFDMFGVGEEWLLGGTGSIVETMAKQAAGLGLTYRLSDLPANVGSDHASFTAVGIPAVIVNCFCDPNYHTSQDASAFVEPDRLKDAGDLGMTTIDALLAAE